MHTRNSSYRGRFAPSPTGPLHKGSLVAAIASFLEAKSHRGKWLLRMEDVDELRNVKGAANSILRSLDAFGFEWDEDILYQTQRKDAYAHAIETLQKQNLVYPCTCSRKFIRAQAEQNKIKTGPFGNIYPGSCIHKKFTLLNPDDYAIRIKVTDQPIQFKDAILGNITHQLKTDLGDFIIRRRDGLFAYQLAVVVDDAFQNISHIVRGSDLLDSTTRQLYLQGCLSHPPPKYAHVPLMRCKKGDKLSKQTGAKSIGETADIPLIVGCLEFLGQNPPDTLKYESLDNVWQWALKNWQLDKLI